jgi:hypothetical protein
MVKSKPVIITLSFVVIGVLIYFFIFQSEERKIIKRFKSFSQTASKRAEDSQLIVAGKSKKISKFFAQTCQIEAQEYNVSKNYSQADIHAVAYQVLNRYLELELKFIDLTVDIPEKGIAKVVSTARIIGKVKNGQEYLEDSYEINCRLEKIEDEWFFVKFELVDVLKK